MTNHQSRQTIDYPSLTNTDGPMKTRFAPSPTGFLHLGHIASALWVWGMAEINQGQVILRIEDHDEGRARKEHIEEIIHDLVWLGFHPHVGLNTQGHLQPEYLQSNLKAKYFEVIQAMIQSGDAYYCHCSRKEIAERTSPLQKKELYYDGHCASLGLGPKSGSHSIRFRVPESKVSFTDLRLGFLEQSPYDQCGDFTIVDRAGQVTYQFSCVYDDLTQKVNTIIRGTDLLHATGRQIILREKLAKYLKMKAIPELSFLHHPVLLDAKTGKKLSKRQFSESIGKLRLEGMTPSQMLNLVCKEMGWKFRITGKELKLQEIFGLLRSMQSR